MRRQSVAGIVVFLAMQSAVDVAHAAHPGVAFRDERTLKLKPGSPESVRTMDVCNVSGVDALQPTPVVSSFDHDTDPPATLMTAAVKDQSSPWKAGDCRALVLTLTGGATSPPEPTPASSPSHHRSESRAERSS